MFAETAAFLVSKSGRMFGAALAFLVVGAAAIAVHTYRTDRDHFAEDEFEDSLATMRLVDAFVGTYGDFLTRALDSNDAVLISFRAHAIERFRASEGQTNLRMRWLGLPGREVRTAPHDDSTRKALVAAALSHDIDPVSQWLVEDGATFHRTILPSVAEQACVDCHNRLMGDRAPWQRGDVMGAFVIDTPADEFLAKARGHAAAVAAAILLIGGSAFAVIFWLQYKRHEADIFAATTAERELTALAARDAAEAANRAKSEFLAMMSHELRTPLNAINGFSEMIVEEVCGPAPERYRRYAQDIHQSGTHLLTIINDILDMAKADAGRMVLKEEVVPLADIVSSCLRTVERRADAGNVALVAGFPPGLALRGDATKLKQVVLNLLSNAVKFTPAGGRVELSARLDDDGGLKILVSDTGIGIEPHDLGRVLRPFEQIASQLHRGHEGTGLGLPLAKALADLHGGSLTPDSAPGHGTRATVRLPSARVLHPDFAAA